jgi:CDP-diacylglycerol--glycerol-3-phosphate 3-phosphatidyltransferase
MADAEGRIITARLQKTFLKILSPVIHLLTKWEVSPNTVTLTGLFITILSAVAFTVGYIRPGGFLVLLGGLCDTFDGSIARSTGRTTRYGAFFDSVIDRYSELVMFFGVTAHFIRINDYQTAIVLFFALCGSIMVSYCRARAESLGFDAKAGIMQRAERIILLGFGALIHVAALKIAIWIIAILSNLTALQRIRQVYRQEADHIKHKENIETEH